MQNDNFGSLLFIFNVSNNFWAAQSELRSSLKPNHPYRVKLVQIKGPKIVNNFGRFGYSGFFAINLVSKLAKTGDYNRSTKKYRK